MIQNRNCFTDNREYSIDQPPLTCRNIVGSRGKNDDAVEKQQIPIDNEDLSVNIHDSDNEGKISCTDDDKNGDFSFT